MNTLNLRTAPPARPEAPPDFWGTMRVHLVLVAILTLAVAMRFPYIGVIGHGDLPYFNAPWARMIQQEGLFGVYAQDDEVNYPPLYLIMLAGVAAVQPISSESFFVHFDPQLLFLLKFIPIASELLLIVAVYYWLPRGNRLRWLIPVLLAIYPGLLLNTPFWGQTDAILATLLAVCLMALNRDRPVWSWVLLALALLMKFQAIILLPLVACLSFRRYGWRRTALGAAVGAVMVAAVMIPFVMVSGYEAAMRPYNGAVDLYRYTSLNAYNLWYLLDPGNWVVAPGLPTLWEFISDKLLLFDAISYKDAGLVMFAIYGLLILMAAWRHSDKRREFVWAGALYFGFFMLPTQIHERYLYPAAVFTLVGVVQDRRLWPVALGTLFTYSYNVLVVVDERFYWLRLDFVTLFGNIAIYAALLNMVLLAWVTWVAVSRPSTVTEPAVHLNRHSPISWLWREWSERVQRFVGCMVWGGGVLAAGLIVVGILIHVLATFW